MVTADQHLLGEGEMGNSGKKRDYKGGTRRLLRMIGMFTILMAVMVPWVGTYVRIHQFVLYKYVYFVICQLNLDKAVFQNKNKVGLS